jgi:beta-mannosidase
MVWQDFAMACASYPQDDRFKALIKKEATAVIRKLRNHPSIVIWAGDNEIDELHNGYGSDPAKNKITREWLPEAVDLNDPSRPYLASSPYYAPGTTLQTMPEAHLWGPRDYFKSDYYKNSNAHFISETGYHGCPSLESIKKFITPENVWPYANNKEWNLHSSDQYDWDFRTMLMEKQVAQLFGDVPTDPEEYILASQISQAEAKKYFIKRMRVGRPIKTGIIWWNLLDGWPQMSDAVVDYYYEKKLAYYYIKRSQAPFAIIADEMHDWGLPLFACNDTLEEKRGHYKVKDAASGEILNEGDFVAPANASTRIASLPLFFSDKRMLIFEWNIGGEVGINHYQCGYPPFTLGEYTELLKKYRLGE